MSLNIPMGTLRFLYNLQWEAAHKIALELKATIKNFPTSMEINDSRYDIKILNDILNKLPQQSTLNQSSTITIQALQSIPGTLAYPNSDIFYWAVLSSDIDSLIKNGYETSLDYNYLNYIRLQNKDIQQKMEFFRYNNPEDFIKALLLDLSEVDMYNATKLLYENGYSKPSRQHFESHPYITFSWDEFNHVQSSSQYSLHQNECIKQWENILPKINDKKQRIAVLICIEKCKGLSHPKAYDIVFKGKNIKEKSKTDHVSRIKKCVEEIAENYGLSVPPWNISK